MVDHRHFLLPTSYILQPAAYILQPRLREQMVEAVATSYSLLPASYFLQPRLREQMVEAVAQPGRVRQHAALGVVEEGGEQRGEVEMR